MNLKLENIGIVKKADINLDGLTVIAGENDTGKSTVGKALYSIIKSISNNGKLSKDNLINNFNSYFNSDISDNGKIRFSKDKSKIDINILNNTININSLDMDRCFYIVNNANSTYIFIETPLV